MHLLLLFLWCIASLGHFGLCIFIYNRINATGLPRWFLKIFDKFLAIFFAGTFLGVLYLALPTFQMIVSELNLFSAESFPATHPVVKVWLCVSIVLAIGMGIPWLRYRPFCSPDQLSVKTKQRRVHACDELTDSPALSWRCRIQSKFPLNQILQLEIVEKALPVQGLPRALDGLKIAHLTDLHLTGDIAPEFHAMAFDHAARWQPDVVFITGDIVDSERCIPWLEKILRPIASPLGKYFVLGNHDRRVSDPSRIRAEMRRWGWVDVAGASLRLRWQDADVELLGTEVPWFGALPSIKPETSAFRILLSHSPDQIAWAREHHIHLMLAGHTHGGQGRLPIFGPILSPSWYGSRFASGEFYLAPTVMHVSRGLSGTHLARIHCPPEVSLLTLHAMSAPVSSS